MVSDPVTTVDTGNPEAVRRFIECAHPVDAATLLEQLAAAEIRDLLLAEPLARRSEIFGYLRSDTQVALAHLLDRRRLAEVVTEMSADDRAGLFNRLSPEQQAALLPGLAQAEREDIRRLAAHAEGTAGTIMTSDYATLAPELTAGQAVEALRREAPDKETIYRAYVLDAQRRLIGSVRLHDLILARADSKVAELMEREPLAVGLAEDQEEVPARSHATTSSPCRWWMPKAGWSASSPTTTRLMRCRRKRPRTSTASARWAS